MNTSKRGAVTMNAHADITHIRGVIPAMFSTFDESEHLDLDRAKILVDHLIGSGVDGLYITGSTGEGFLMTDEERKAFAEAVVGAVDGRSLSSYTLERSARNARLSLHGTQKR